MNQEIIIRHLHGSSLTGSVQRFAKATIRIGRSSENDVAFDPYEDILVSARHAELSLEGERLWLRDLDSRNGTFVNGRRISSPRVLQAGDQIALGQRGPLIQIGLAQAETATPESPVPDVDVTLPEGRVHPEVTWSLSERLGHRDERRPEHAESGAPGRAIGMNTLMGVIRRARAVDSRRSIRRSLILGCAIGSALLFVSKLTNGSGGSNVAAWSSESLDEVVDPLESSVYVVLRRTQLADGRYQEIAQGTAWSVEKGLLATNAHVADLFYYSDPEGRPTELVVRSSSNPVHEARVVGARQHPGFAAFNEMAEMFKPYLPGRGGFLNIPSPCDVGLLELDSRDVEGQAPALALADREALDELRSARPLAYVGFPAEGIAANGTDLSRPNATTMTGTLAKLSDVFFGKAERFEDQIVLAYQLDVVGGASGSPVFDEWGRVVGLIAAINVGAGGQRSIRIPIGGTSYGPRIDLLRELLDGDADERQRERELRWKEMFHAAFKRGTDSTDELANSLALIELAAAHGVRPEQILGLSVVEKKTIQLRGSGRSKATDTLVAIPERGIYSVVAIAKDQPIPLLMQAVDLSSEEFRGDPYFVSAHVDLAGRRSLKLRIRGEHENKSLSSSVDVFVIEVSG